MFVQVLNCIMCFTKEYLVYDVICCSATEADGRATEASRVSFLQHDVSLAIGSRNPRQVQAS
jgi:hypothetical protein